MFKLLLVEDHKGMLKILTKVLRKHYVVQTATGVGSA